MWLNRILNVNNWLFVLGVLNHDLSNDDILNIDKFIVPKASEVFWYLQN